MNDNLFYNQNVMTLFVCNFDEISLRHKKEDFNFVEFENIFNFIFSKLSHNDINEDDFIKYYYMFTFLYLNYTNYLVYIKHPDVENPNLEKLATVVKTSLGIVKNIFKFISNENIQKIIKINDIFVLNKIKKNTKDTNIKHNITSYIYNIKQIDKISKLENNNYKKILEVL